MPAARLRGALILIILFHIDTDHDGDGILDVDDPDHITNLDSDGDGLTDIIDPDDDNDGILDIDELPEYGRFIYRLI